VSFVVSPHYGPLTFHAALATNWQDGQVSLFSTLCGPIRIMFLDDIFKSTVHRAINRTGVERYSIPLFFGTDYDVLLEVRISLVASRVLVYKACVPIHNPIAATFMRL